MARDRHEEARLTAATVGGAVIDIASIVAGVLGPGMVGHALWFAGVVTGVVVGTSAIAWGAWPRRSDGSFRFFLRTPERLPAPPSVTVTYEQADHWSRPNDPYSVLRVNGLEITNATDTPVEVQVTARWSHQGQEIVADEKHGRGMFRAEAHSIGPRPPIKELLFEMPRTESRRLRVNFVWVERSTRDVRVVNRVSGEVLTTIGIADASWLWQVKQSYLSRLRKSD